MNVAMYVAAPGSILDDNGETEADSDPAEFFPRCLPIDCMLHILDNLTKHYLEKLPHWDQFKTMLQAFMTIFGWHFRIERFLEKRVGDVPERKSIDKMFTAACPSIATWRWGTLTTTLEWIVVRLPIIRRFLEWRPI